MCSCCCCALSTHHASCKFSLLPDHLLPRRLKSSNSAQVSLFCPQLLTTICKPASQFKGMNLASHSSSSSMPLCKCPGRAPIPHLNYLQTATAEYRTPQRVSQQPMHACTDTHSMYCALCCCRSSCSPSTAAQAASTASRRPQQCQPCQPAVPAIPAPAAGKLLLRIVSDGAVMRAAE
jgi:hypothetical protein